MSRVNLADRVIFKSKSDYVKSIGEGLHSATIGMTFNQKEMNNHVAKIGEVLADTLKKAGITYGNSVKDSNGNSDITPMNLIDKDGFKMPDSKQTDCNRFLAGVLYSAGLFPASVYSNLNQDVYLSPEGAKERSRMEAATKPGGVEFIRQSPFLEKVGFNLSNKNLNGGKVDSKKKEGNEPFVGAVGITRKLKDKAPTGSEPYADHVYIVTEDSPKRDDKTGKLGKIEGYYVVESVGGEGPSRNWYPKNAGYFTRSEYYQVKPTKKD